MYTKDTHRQLAFALFTALLLFGTRTRTTLAVVNPGQFARFQTQSYYSPSLSSYGNEHEHYTAELSSGGGYSNEPYKHHQYPSTGYTSIGSGFDDGGDGLPSNHPHRSEHVHQRHSDFQDSVKGHYSAFGQNQDSEPDNLHPQYSDDTEASSLVSFYNIDFNNSEALRYQATEDIMYPPLQPTRTDQQRQQHQSPATQHYAVSTDYIAANNNVLPPRGHSPYLHEGKLAKDTMSASNLAGTAAGADLTVTTGRLPPPPSVKANQIHARNQMNVRPYVENANQQQHQRDQYHISRTSETPQFQSENSKNNERVSNGSSSRTYYVADSDLSASNNNQVDTESLSVLHSHLVQLPTVASSSHGSVSLPNYGIPSEPIPISKHVEITKHIPIPVFRQVHVPYRKPVRIEIPRPVVTTIPRPYPIHIPTIMKPVTLPTVKEIKIPIEKVTPYPVEHKVPYIVEKRVPFQIEKQVASPVYYPFPVRVPMIRTIVHKKKSHLPLFQYRPRIHM